MEEPSVVLPPREGAVVVTPEEEQPSQDNAPHRYALADRVADGVTIKVNRVLVVIRVKGLLKDAPPGLWTPPVLVLEMKGLHFRSCDEAGNEHGGDLRAIWRLANQKAAEVMVYKHLSMERFSLKLVPSWPPPPPEMTTASSEQLEGDNVVQIRASGAENKNNKKTGKSLLKAAVRAAAEGLGSATSGAVAGEAAVLIDASPSPFDIFVTIRRRRSDSAVLGVQAGVEALEKIDLRLDSKGLGLLIHFGTGLAQCIYREGELAWTDEAFRARLWEAVDRGELPQAKLYGAQAAAEAGKEGGQSFQHAVEDKVAGAAAEEDDGNGNGENENRNDSDQEDDMRDDGIDESLHAGTIQSAASAVVPRIAAVFIVNQLDITVGANSQSVLGDGGTRLELRGINAEAILNVDAPPEVLTSSLNKANLSEDYLNENESINMQESIEAEFKMGESNEQCFKASFVQLRLSEVRIDHLDANGDPIEFGRSPLLHLGQTETGVTKRSQTGGNAANCFPFAPPPLRFVPCGVERGFNSEVMAVSKEFDTAAHQPRLKPTDGGGRLNSRRESLSAPTLAGRSSSLFFVSGVSLDKQGWCDDGGFASSAERDAILARFKGAKLEELVSRTNPESRRRWYMNGESPWFAALTAGGSKKQNSAAAATTTSDSNERSGTSVRDLSGSSTHLWRLAGVMGSKGSAFAGKAAAFALTAIASTCYDFGPRGYTETTRVLGGSKKVKVCSWLVVGYLSPARRLMKCIGGFVSKEEEAFPYAVQTLLSVAIEEDDERDRSTLSPSSSSSAAPFLAPRALATLRALDSECSIDVINHTPAVNNNNNNNNNNNGRNSSKNKSSGRRAGSKKGVQLIFRLDSPHRGSLQVLLKPFLKSSATPSPASTAVAAAAHAEGVGGGLPRNHHHHHHHAVNRAGDASPATTSSRSANSSSSSSSNSYTTNADSTCGEKGPPTSGNHPLPPSSPPSSSSAAVGSRHHRRSSFESIGRAPAAPYVLGVVVASHQRALDASAVPFGSVASKVSVDVPAVALVHLNAPRMASLLHGPFSHVVDPRWSTGQGWDLTEAVKASTAPAASTAKGPRLSNGCGSSLPSSSPPSSSSDMLSIGRIEPQVNLVAAPQLVSLVYLNLRGGFRIKIPPHFSSCSPSPAPFLSPQASSLLPSPNSTARHHQRLPLLPGLELSVGPIAVARDFAACKFGGVSAPLLGRLCERRGDMQDPQSSRQEGDGDDASCGCRGEGGPTLESGGLTADDDETKQQEESGGIATENSSDHDAASAVAEAATADVADAMATATTTTVTPMATTTETTTLALATRKMAESVVPDRWLVSAQNARVQLTHLDPCWTTINTATTATKTLEVASFGVFGVAISTDLLTPTTHPCRPHPPLPSNFRDSKATEGEVGNPATSSFSSSSSSSSLAVRRRSSLRLGHELGLHTAGLHPPSTSSSSSLAADNYYHQHDTNNVHNVHESGDDSGAGTGVVGRSQRAHTLDLLLSAQKKKRGPSTVAAAEGAAEGTGDKEGEGAENSASFPTLPPLLPFVQGLDPPFAAQGVLGFDAQLSVGLLLEDVRVQGVDPVALVAASQTLLHAANTFTSFASAPVSASVVSASASNTNPASAADTGDGDAAATAAAAAASTAHGTSASAAAAKRVEANNGLLSATKTKSGVGEDGGDNSVAAVPVFEEARPSPVHTALRWSVSDIALALPLPTDANDDDPALSLALSSLSSSENISIKVALLAGEVKTTTSPTTTATNTIDSTHAAATAVVDEYESTTFPHSSSSSSSSSSPLDALKSIDVVVQRAKVSLHVASASTSTSSPSSVGCRTGDESVEGGEGKGAATTAATTMGSSSSSSTSRGGGGGGGSSVVDLVRVDCAELSHRHQHHHGEQEFGFLAKTKTAAMPATTLGDKRRGLTTMSPLMNTPEPSSSSLSVGSVLVMGDLAGVCGVVDRLALRWGSDSCLVPAARVVVMKAAVCDEAAAAAAGDEGNRRRIRLSGSDGEIDAASAARRSETNTHVGGIGGGGGGDSDGGC